MVPILFLRREGDSNPRYSYPYDSLANCWFQPLTHLSKVYITESCSFIQKASAKVLLFFYIRKCFSLFFCICQKKMLILQPK